MRNLLTFLFFLFCFTMVDAQIIQRYSKNYNPPFDQKKRHILKVDLMFLVTRNLSFSYEHSVKQRESVEVQIGFIGLGLADHRYEKVYQGTQNERTIKVVSEGFFFSGGYKFFRLPEKKEREPHIFHGLYFKPELIFGFYNVNQFERTGLPTFTSFPISKKKVNYQALLANFGVQVVLKDFISIDLFVGLGIATEYQSIDSNSSSDLGFEHPGIFKTDEGVSSVVNIGLKLGFLFQ